MTPSALRRQGREAFDPQVSEPLDLCPHRSEFKVSSWMEGWHEEEKAYQAEQQSAKDNDSLHDEIMAEIENAPSSQISALVKLLINRGVFQ